MLDQQHCGNRSRYEEQTLSLVHPAGQLGQQAFGPVPASFSG